MRISSSPRLKNSGGSGAAAFTETPSGSRIAFLAYVKHLPVMGQKVAGITTLPISRTNSCGTSICHHLEAAIRAKVGSLTSAYADINGVPVTGNRFLLQDILRDTPLERGSHQYLTQAADQAATFRAEGYHIRDMPRLSK